MTTKSIAVVTGGAGFIGSHMVDVLLAHGYKVRVIDNLTGGRKSNLAHLEGNADVECFWLDIRALEPHSAVFKDVRFVFHFAGIGDIVPSIEKPIEYMDVNVQGTVRVLECARTAGVEKFVYAASSSCYGLAATPTDDIRSYHINSDKIKRVLGYAPRHTIEDAVRELCKAFLANRIPNSMEDDRYYNVRLLKRLKAA